MSTPEYFPRVFDSSMLGSYKSCAQLCNKIYFEHWKGKTEKIDLHAGKSFASGLEAGRRAFFEGGASAEVAEACALQELVTSYGTFECPSDNPKSLERMVGALEFYFDNYPLTHAAGYPILAPGGKRAVEYSFAHPLPILHPISQEPLFYVGRSDAIIHYAGDNYICDEKTTKSLGPTWSSQWDLRSQLIGYTWGFRESGFRVAGVIVRGVSILKTKYETQESINSFSEFEIHRWYVELLEWIEEIVQRWKTGRWRYNLDSSCTQYGGCGFKSVCKQENEQPWLEQYFERRIWDPVTREERKL